MFFKKFCVENPQLLASIKLLTNCEMSPLTIFRELVPVFESRL
jgi:hypothetical protein